MNALGSVLSGAAAMAYGISSLFFLRFWRRADDPLFLHFSAAFAFFAINQALVGLYGRDSETDATFYLLRLIGFAIIIVAIVRKNLNRT